MKRQVIFTLGIILLIGIVGAEVNLTAGESYSFVLTEPYSYYEITGNQTEVNLNITKNESNVTIYLGKYNQEDSFDLTFYNWKDEVVYPSSGRRSSSGGSCKVKKDYDWKCSEWIECINETQTRTCKERNNCGNTYGRPDVTKSCVVEKVDEGELLIIEGCETDECCNNLGFDKWNESTLECESNNYFWWWFTIILIFIVLAILFFTLKKKEINGEKTIQIKEKKGKIN